MDVLPECQEDDSLVPDQDKTMRDNDDGSEWTEVAPKSSRAAPGGISSAVTRSTEIPQETMVSRLFSGRMRNVLKYPSSNSDRGKQSVTLEPFSPLSIEISPNGKELDRVEDALAALGSVELLSDFVSGGETASCFCAFLTREIIG